MSDWKPLSGEKIARLAEQETWEKELSVGTRMAREIKALREVRDAAERFTDICPNIYDDAELRNLRIELFEALAKAKGGDSGV